MIMKVADDNSRAARRADHCRITMCRLDISSRITDMTIHMNIRGIRVGVVVAPHSEERLP